MFKLQCSVCWRNSTATKQTNKYPLELQKVVVNTLSITTEMYAKVTTFIYR